MTSTTCQKQISGTDFALRGISRVGSEAYWPGVQNPCIRKPVVVYSCVWFAVGS
jgi:hypothetical protein